MAVKFPAGISLEKSQLQNAVFHLVAGDVTTPSEGQFWYNQTTKRPMYRTDAGTFDFTNALTLGGSSLASVLSRANHTGTQLAATISDFAAAADARITAATITQAQVSGLADSLALKANLASPTFTGTVSGITKGMVGLGNVDNTSDADKPVSTATSTALGLKANLASPTFTGTVSGITAAMVGLGNVNNTSDADKPVSTAQQSALNLKANLAGGATFTGDIRVPTVAAGTNDTLAASTAYVVSEIAARLASQDAMVYKGVIAAGTGGTQLPAADAGHTYRVSTAGTIGGVNLEAGDVLICFVDGTTAGTTFTNWNVIQTNIDGAVTLTGTQTLTNKTLTSPVISTISNSGTITIPTGTDTLVGRATTDTLTNKTLTAPVISTISNSGTITLPTGTRTLVARDTTDTLTNKTLTAPVISTISNTGTLTLPTSTDTLVGRATTDTLTNKTLNNAVFTGTTSGISTTNLTEGTNLFYTDERVQDAVNALLITNGNVHSGISFVYDDVNNRINATVTGQGTVKKYSTLIGDGTATSIVITQATHTLAPNSQNLVVVNDVTTGEIVHPDILVAPSTGNVTINFAVAPAANSYRVTILG